MGVFETLIEKDDAIRNSLLFSDPVARSSSPHIQVSIQRERGEYLQEVRADGIFRREVRHARHNNVVLVREDRALAAIEAIPRVGIRIPTRDRRGGKRVVGREFEIRKAVAPYPFLDFLLIQIVLEDIDSYRRRTFSVLRNIRESLPADERYDVTGALTVPRFPLVEYVPVGIAERYAIHGIRVRGRRRRGPLPWLGHKYIYADSEDDKKYESRRNHFHRGTVIIIIVYARST